MRPSKRLPVTPGKVLLEDYIKPAGTTQNALANHLGTNIQRITQIVKYGRRITAGSAWMLAGATGTTPEFWMNLQVAYDIARTKPKKPGKPMPQFKAKKP